MIGPAGEWWDLILLVRHRDVRTFPFTDSEDYLAYIGHRTAALADSRLVPVTSTPPDRDDGGIA